MKFVQPLRFKCWKKLECVKTGMIKRTFQRLKSFTDFIAFLLRLYWLLLGRFQGFS